VGGRPPRNKSEELGPCDPRFRHLWFPHVSLTIWQVIVKIQGKFSQKNLVMSMVLAIVIFDISCKPILQFMIVFMLLYF